jgi:hypothetical protein
MKTFKTEITAIIPHKIDTCFFEKCVCGADKTIASILRVYKSSVERVIGEDMQTYKDETYEHDVARNIVNGIKGQQRSHLLKELE